LTGGNPDTAIPRKVDDTQMLMAISRTPYRVSFFGGGTDYPAWYRRHGGAVLSMAIDKHCYIGTGFLPPFFGIRHRIIWSHIEAVGAISEILHPAVRAGLQTLGFDDTQGIELFHQGDLPARSGIGSSSASPRARWISSRTSSRKASDARTRSPAPTAA
jgi:D-glycero-alpha-D-manno-heptose-7-phosphate kinase